MSPDNHIDIINYAMLDIDAQVRMQIALAKHYARDFYDVALTTQELREEVIWILEHDLKELEIYEKYEYCMLYKDTIENIKYIPIDKLY